MLPKLQTIPRLEIDIFVEYIFRYTCTRNVIPQQIFLYICEMVSLQQVIVDIRNLYSLIIVENKHVLSQ